MSPSCLGIHLSGLNFVASGPQRAVSLFVAAGAMTMRVPLGTRWPWIVVSTAASRRVMGTGEK